MNVKYTLLKLFPLLPRLYLLMDVEAYFNWARMMALLLRISLMMYSNCWLWLLLCRFHHQRVPLVILVCGTACAGKSTIATQLAQRLNLPNVLQVNNLY